MAIPLDIATLPGWFTFDAYYKMIAGRLQTGDHFVEVGVYQGRSFFHLAHWLKELEKEVCLIAVDAWTTQSDGVPNDNTIFEAFQSRIHRFDYTAMAMRLSSVEAAALFDPGSLTGVFIDASHDYDSVVADIAAWCPKIKSGGFIGGHDFDRGVVAKAVEQIFRPPFKYDREVWHVEDPKCQLK